MSYQSCADPFPLTETGDAEFFADIFGDRLRFDHCRKRWLVFQGHRWVVDNDSEPYRLGVLSMRRRQAAALDIPDADAAEKHFRWAIRGESRHRLASMLALAGTMEPRSDDGKDWDADPWLLGVENGVFDLRTGSLREGKPEDRITMSVRPSFESTAICPRWEQMIQQVFGHQQDVIGFVQRALGYSLTGITREQCLFMTWGGGANGKSTLINAVAYVLGDYADDLPFSTLLADGQRAGTMTNDVAKTRG